MTDAELKAHIDVLSVAVASLAVETKQSSATTKALEALVEQRPELSGAADALNRTLARLQDEQKASDWISGLSNCF